MFLYTSLYAVSASVIHWDGIGLFLGKKLYRIAQAYTYKNRQMSTKRQKKKINLKSFRVQQ